MSSVDSRPGLDDMPWNDLKAFAKEHGVPCKGTREALTDDILHFLDKENLPMVSARKKKAATPGKASSTKKIPLGIATAQPFLQTSLLNSPPPKQRVTRKSTAKKMSTRKAAQEAEAITEVVSAITKSINKKSARKSTQKKKLPVPEPEPQQQRDNDDEGDDITVSDVDFDDDEKPVLNTMEDTEETAMSPSKRLFVSNAGPSPQVKLPTSRSAFRRGNFTPPAASPAAPKVMASSASRLKATSRRAQEQARAAAAKFFKSRLLLVAATAAAAAAVLGGAFIVAGGGSPYTVGSNAEPTSEVWTRCANPVVLSQGDSYAECGVGVYPATHPGHDEPPTVEIEYSLPGMPFGKV